MRKHSIAIVAAALYTAFVTGASAQTVSPRDADRPPAELATTPPASPRDGQDRRDVDKDRSDADLAIERDKCGDLDADAKDRCIRTAHAQRDRGVPSFGGATGAAGTLVQPGSPNSTSPQTPGTMTPTQPGPTGTNTIQNPSTSISQPAPTGTNTTQNPTSTGGSMSGGGTTGAAATAPGAARR